MHLRRRLVSLSLLTLAPGCGDQGRDGDDEGGEIVIAEKTRVIDRVDEVVVEADRLLFPRATHPEVGTLEEGTLLVGDRQGPASVRQGNPDGFLRRVLSVEAEGDDFVVRTEEAYVSDMVEHGDFQGQVPVPLGDPVALVPGAPGGLRSVELRPLADRPRLKALGALEFTGLKLGPVDKKIEREFTVKGVPLKAELFVKAELEVAKGSLSLTPDFGLSASFGWGYVKAFEFFLAGGWKAELATKFTFTTGIKTAVDFKQVFGEATEEEKRAFDAALAEFAQGGGLPPMSAKIAEASIDLPTWYIPAFIPIPVVSRADFELGLGCSVSVKGTAQATVREASSASLKVGARYTRDSGWMPIDERSWMFEPASEVVGAVEASAACELKPKFSLVFYGVAGPELEIAGTAKGSLSAKQSCPGMEGRPKVDVSATLAASVSASVGAKFGLFFPKWKIDYTLAEAMLELFKLDFDLGTWELYSGYPDLGFGLCAADPMGCDGDGTCSAGETCMNCAADCGSCKVCGDGECVAGENCGSCPQDCGGACDACGDGTCGFGEDCEACPADCPTCETCGDGECGWSENCAVCEGDCGACPSGCGDFVCDEGETCESCPDDCGACGSVCGDWVCEADESCELCPEDCGACGSVCGDLVCDGGESCESCEEDCGACYCGDNFCSASETCNSCEWDCGACSCPCVADDPNFDDFCDYPPSTPGCAMTEPYGYCDPDGDGLFDDADLGQAAAEYAAQCF